MFEQISISHPKQTHKLSELKVHAPSSLDIEILKAYERITSTYKDMLRKHISKSKGEHIHWQWPWQIHKQNLIQEFVCQFCSIRLVRVEGQHKIILWIGVDTLQNGTGVNSNAMLRVAFTHTMKEHTSLMIEQCLEIVWCGNPLEYYDKKLDEYEEQSAIRFAKPVPTKL